MPRSALSKEIAHAFRSVEVPESAAARMTAAVRSQPRHRTAPRPGRARRGRFLLPTTAAAAVIITGLAIVFIARPFNEGEGGHPGAVGRAAPSHGGAAPGAAIPEGDREDLVSIEAAQSRVGFQILLPDSLPDGYDFAGAVVLRGDSQVRSQVRVHFAGPGGEVVLVEQPSKGGPREPEGFEFKTSVNGYPALGVRGDLPPDPTGPVSQVQWWTGGMYFDIYGPVPYDGIERTALSVPQTS